MIDVLIDMFRDQVDWQLAPDDPMFTAEAHYRGVGESALKIMLGCLLLAHRPPPRSVLDFACATGRVTRWMRAGFPDAALHVSDINADWANWTARRFGAVSWPSHADLSLVQAPQRYDLIWAGSLATHLTEADAALLFRRFHDWLEPDGIAIVTTHGRRFAEWMTSGRLTYFPTETNEADRLALLHSYARDGYGFVPYPAGREGISMNSLEWAIATVRKLGARVIATTDQAWDTHHDIIAFQRVQG